jgi:uncharacterized membrane protein
MAGGGFGTAASGSTDDMTQRAAITINHPREVVESRWRDSAHFDGIQATTSFSDAPGDRGTEIHVLIQDAPGKVGQAVKKVRGDEPVAKVKDELRRFKQLVETRVIARSDSTPEGELLERKMGQRPAQPLDDSELEKAGV